jgi:hypothetical protein
MLRATGVGEVGDTGGRPWFFVAVAGLTTYRFVVGFNLGTLTEPTMTAACDGGVADADEPRAAWSRGVGAKTTRAPACGSTACGSTWDPSFTFSLGSAGAWSASEVPL